MEQGEVTYTWRFDVTPWRSHSRVFTVLSRLRELSDVIEEAYEAVVWYYRIREGEVPGVSSAASEVQNLQDLLKRARDLIAELEVLVRGLEA